MRVSIKLAKSKNEHETALRLIHESWKGSRFFPAECGDLWLLKHHALPSTNTIIAIAENQIVGALSIFGESAFRLPLEDKVNLKPFRESLRGRIAEISLPATKANARSKEIHSALYHFAFCFGSTYCHYDAFVSSAPESAKLQEMNFTPLAGPETYILRAADSPDLRASFPPGFEAEFQYPEKKFFLVAHQSIEPGTLKYLFSEKTDLFERMSDLELRVLKNFYDHGEFASVLPNRPSDLPFKEEPKHRRFPMNCDGYLCLGNGERVNLQVLDVSKEGLKIRYEDELPKGTHPLNLSIGVMKQSEVIAEVVWTDEVAQIAGLRVKSSDTHWNQLITYLENEAQKTVA